MPIFIPDITSHVLERDVAGGRVERRPAKGTQQGSSLRQPPLSMHTRTTGWERRGRGRGGGQEGGQEGNPLPRNT